MSDFIKKSDGIFYILGNDEDHIDHEALFRELKKRGYEGKTVHPHNITTVLTKDGAEFFNAGIQIRPALVLGWVYEDLLIPGMYLLTAFERSGIPVINSAETLFCGQNKYLNSEALHRNGIKHLPIICGFSDTNLDVWLPSLKFPVVLKPVVGACGRSVVKADSPEALKSLAKVIAGFGQNYYIQPYIEKSGSRDIRVTCVNYKAVHAFYRYSENGKWITNLSSGGRGEKIELTSRLSEIAEKAAKAMNAMIAGVDIAENIEDNEYYVIEVNTCPNFQVSPWIHDASTLAEEKLAELMICIAHEKEMI